MLNTYLSQANQVPIDTLQLIDGYFIIELLQQRVLDDPIFSM
jgi:hypothetical protein